MSARSIVAVGALLVVAGCTGHEGSGAGTTGDFEQNATGPQTTVLGTTLNWPVCEVQKAHQPQCDARALPNVPVVAFAEPDLDHPVAQATSDSNSRFTLKLTKGRYTIELKDYEHWTGSGPVEIVVSGHGTAYTSVRVTALGG